MNRLALILAAGPITGPLLCGLLSCAKAGRWFMAATYGTAIIEAWALLPAAEVWLLKGLGL